MFSPFQTCWDRVARAEVHRQALIKTWEGIDVQDVYSTEVEVDNNGNGKLFFRNVKQDWLLPFAFQVGEMLYHLRSGLESCIYDAAILEFKADPPPDEERWGFLICATPEKFDDAARRMKKLPDALRRLMEAVQPYARASCGTPSVPYRWDLGKVLDLLNLWAKIDRHRRLNLVGTAVTRGNVGFGFSSLGTGMSVVDFGYSAGQHLLEDGTELATFRVENFVPDAEIHVDAQFSIEILVNEAPGMCKLQDAALTMGLSVSAVRESFERHYGIKRV